MIPTPPPLSPDEFHRRRAELLRQGKPITVENVDPEFMQWVRSQRRRRLLKIALLILASIACIILFVIHAGWRSK